jgi:hypothetical protein
MGKKSFGVHGLPPDAVLLHRHNKTKKSPTFHQNIGASLYLKNITYLPFSRCGSKQAIACAALFWAL